MAEAETYLEPPKPRANLKDPAKIAADVTEKTTALLERASLDPDLCRIVAVGWECGGLAESAVCENAVEERRVLERFWQQSRGATLVGFNCLGFDLPVLLRRSLYLGVAAPLFALNKYRPGAIVDLMQRLAYQGTLTYRSLGFYCARFGITVPDRVTGAAIGQLVAAGEWRSVHDHVRADVAKTTALARRVGVIPDGAVTPTPAACERAAVVDGVGTIAADSPATDLAFPKPVPLMLERQQRRACHEAHERRENAKVRTRSGGRCEVVLGEARCRKAGREVHHLLGGHGRRGRGASALASHKVHTCVEHHRLMGLRWIDVTWTTPEHPVASLQFRQVRGMEAG
ncbi:MAG: hypothetical protein O2976_03290 [Actinomycetota bacterium]|nr:hypothetical protein [Actinomycetota bacterium]